MAQKSDVAREFITFRWPLCVTILVPMKREVIRTPKFPEYIIVETSSRCNFRCVMCDREHTRRPVADMSLDLFKQIVDEAVKYPTTKLFLQFLGEPLLNRQIIPMIRYAKESGISFVSISTNGMLLNRNGLDDGLLVSGIDEINISVDGATKETFEQIRPRVSFERIEKNIRSLLIKRKGGQPRINLTFLQLPDNKNEEDAFVEKWVGLVDNVILKAGLDNDRKVIRRELVDLSRIRIPCMELWSVMVIYNNGDVGICCEDLYNSAIKGNIKMSPMYDIWTSDQYEKIRQNQINGNYETPTMCRHCEYWRRADTESAKNEIYESFTNPGV